MGDIVKIVKMEKVKFAGGMGKGSERFHGLAF